MPFDGAPGGLIRRPAGAIPQGVPRLDPSDPINAGLVARYLLAAAGPYDLSPQGNNGTLNGSSATRPGFAPSRVGPMRSFASASSQYFDCAAATGLPNTGGNLTLAIWAYLTGTTGRQIIFSLVNSESGASYADIEINGTTLSVNGQSSATSGTLPAGSYPGLFLIVYTQRGAANTLYLNGAQLTTNTAGRNPTAPTVIRIASFNSAFPSPYFNGPADNAGVWNRALSPAEIARLWRDPFGGLVFPGDRLWLWSIAAGGGGTSVNAAATGLTQTAGRISLAGRTSLAARGGILTAGRTSLSGRAAAAGRGLMVTAGRASLAGSATAAARGATQSTGRATLAGSMPAALRGITQATGRVAGTTAALVAAALRGLSLMTGRASLAGTASVALRSSAQSSGKAGLAGHVTTALRGVAQTSGRTVIVAGQVIIAAARGLVLASGRLSLSGATAVGLRGSVQTAGRAALAGRVAAVLRGIAQSSGRAVLISGQLVTAILRGLALLRGALGAVLVPALVPTLPFVRLLPAVRYAVLAPAVRYLVLMPTGDELQSLRPPDFPAITMYAKKTLTVDLGNYLPAGVQLLPGTGSVTLTVLSGSDATPESRLVTGPVIATCPLAVGGTGITNTAIEVQVQPSVANGALVYLLNYAGFQRSDGSDIEAFYLHLPVTAPN